MLWVHPDDVDRIASEITGCIPAQKDAQGNWVTHSAAQKRLLEIVLRKQVHRCTDIGKASQAQLSYSTVSVHSHEVIHHAIKAMCSRNC